MAVEAEEPGASLALLSKDISISVGMSWLGYWWRMSGGGWCWWMDSIVAVFLLGLLYLDQFQLDFSNVNSADR